jgi:hypothetical protein
MHENPTPGESSGQVERAIYTMLIVADEQRPWSVREIELEIGGRERPGAAPRVRPDPPLRRVREGRTRSRCNRAVDAAWSATSDDRT